MTNQHSQPIHSITLYCTQGGVGTTGHVLVGVGGCQLQKFGASKDWWDLGKNIKYGSKQLKGGGFHPPGPQSIGSCLQG